MLEFLNPFRKIDSPIARLYNIKGILTILFWVAIVILIIPMYMSLASNNSNISGVFFVSIILYIIGILIVKFMLDTYLMTKIREQEFIETQLQLMKNQIEMMEMIKKNIEIQTKIQVQGYKKGQ